MKKRREKGLLILIPVLILALGSCVSQPGEEMEPSLKLNVDEMEYISPESSEGVSDILEVSVDFSGKAKIRSYTFRVADTEGKTIREYHIESEDPEKSVELPEQINWRGVDSANDYVPEGTYDYYLSVALEDGKKLTSDLYQVTVDNTPPDLEIDIPYTVFSPNGDGEKDLLIIEQEGSVEHRWRAELSDASGSIIKTYAWDASAPKNLQWNGRNDDGEPFPDGIYTYTISSVDRAGNSIKRTLDSIRLDTSKAQLTLARNLNYLSPNGDNRKDIQEFILEVPHPEEVVLWRIEVVSVQSDEIVRTMGGGPGAPESARFNGKADSGKTVSDGEFYARGAIEYKNGSTAEDETAEFVVDTVEPQAEVRPQLDIFSPNGDGNKETMFITQRTSKEEVWTGTIRSAAGEAVRTFTWKGTAAERLSWKGLNEKGKMVSDGEYTYSLSATDRAGNSYETEPVAFTLDTSAVPQISLKPEHRFFSPNADGTKDSIAFSIDLAVTEGIAGYEFRIEQENGEVVYEKSGNQNPGDTLVWKGRSSDTGVAPNGTYQAYLRITYENGNAPSVTTEPFTLDKASPQIQLSSPYGIFSPDKDGNRDMLPISASSTNEQLWEGIITNEQGEKVRSVVWNGKVSAFTWDGTNDEGNPVADGTYSLQISATDRAGNTGSARIDGIEIDTRPTPIFVKTAADGFSPNGDGRQDVVEFNLYADIMEGIEEWSLRIHDSATGSEIRRFDDKSGNIPESVMWDGTNESEQIVADGQYGGVFTVHYLKGNRPSSSTEKPVIVDATAPEIAINIEPDRFSPDGDGFKDTATFDLDISELNELTEWRVRVLDPNDNRFRVFSGKAKSPQTLTWNGRSADGELVQAADIYTVAVAAQDQFGNRAEVTKQLKTDVFVIEEDGELKIKISSIHFVADEADFKHLEDVKVQQNMETLDRVAEILKRYTEYQITIEGHATHEYLQHEGAMKWEQENELIPLSRKRAEAVKEALVDRGVEEAQLQTAGVGGAEPVVPHNDLENRWKNRRVEFILERNTDRQVRAE